MGNEKLKHIVLLLILSIMGCRQTNYNTTADKATLEFSGYLFYKDEIFKLYYNNILILTDTPGKTKDRYHYSRYLNPPLAIGELAPSFNV